MSGVVGGNVLILVVLSLSLSSVDRELTVSFLLGMLGTISRRLRSRLTSATSSDRRWVKAWVLLCRCCLFDRKKSRSNRSCTIFISCARPFTQVYIPLSSFRRVSSMHRRELSLVATRKRDDLCSLNGRPHSIRRRCVIDKKCVALLCVIFLMWDMFDTFS